MPIITGSIPIVYQTESATGNHNVLGVNNTANASFTIWFVGEPSVEHSLIQVGNVSGSSSFIVDSITASSDFTIVKIEIGSVSSEVPFHLFDKNCYGIQPIDVVCGVPQVYPLDKSVYNPTLDNHIRTSDYFCISRSVSIFKYQFYDRIPTDVDVIIVQGANEGNINIVPWDDTEDDADNFRVITATDTVNLVDTTGPFFSDADPANGETFVDPAGTIVFHVKDYASSIDTLHMLVRIGDDLVYENGSIVSSSGTLTVTQVSNIDYTFSYVPDSPFGLYETVTVSGSFRDSESPANESTDTYWFRTWTYDSGLTATISAGPDTDSPIITPWYPSPTATGVSADTSIVFAVDDYTTGIDPTSIYLRVDGSVIYSGGSTITPSGSVSTITTASGYLVQYTQTDGWAYGSTHSVYISVADNYSPAPNITTTSYNFSVVEDDSLIIRNFFLNVGESMEVDASTTMTVEVVNFTYGIDPTETYFEINGSQVATTLTPIEGGLGYRLSFDPSNDFDYDTVIDVSVHTRSNLP